MANITSTLGTCAGDRVISLCRPASKLQTYGFIIALIVSIGSLALFGVGVAGYCHVGALSSIAQRNAIIMMAVGGGCSTVCIIVGIVRSIKNFQAARSASHEVTQDTSDTTSHEVTQDTSDTTSHEVTQDTSDITSCDRKAGVIYGPQLWPLLGEKLGCKLKIENKIPAAPQQAVPLDRVRFYIPERVSVNGTPKDFTLNNLIEMARHLFDDNQSNEILEQFGNATVSGWVEIDLEKSEIEKSRFGDYETQKKMIETRNCHMPHVLEAVMLNLLIFSFTDEWPFEIEEPRIRSSSRVNGSYPCTVGYSESCHLYLDYDTDSGGKYVTVAVHRFGNK